MNEFSYAGANNEQVDIFKYLGITMHGTRGLSTAIETLCQAAKRAMFCLLRQCHQLHIPEPIVKCKLFDALVKPIFCYGCEIWSITGGKTALAELERTQIGFLKMLLGVQTRTPRPCMCFSSNLPNLANSHCSSHGMPWQASIWNA